jgi:hypothetical protein
MPRPSPLQGSLGFVNVTLVRLVVGPIWMQLEQSAEKLGLDLLIEGPPPILTEMLFRSNARRCNSPTLNPSKCSLRLDHFTFGGPAGAVTLPAIVASGIQLLSKGAGHTRRLHVKFK